MTEHIQSADRVTTQLALPTATELRDAALERVDAAADPEWKEDALLTVQMVCTSEMFFTSEDVWTYLVKPREPRALGPVLRRAVALGYCEPVGFVTSSMTSRHAAPVRQYRSLLADDGPSAAAVRVDKQARPSTECPAHAIPD